MINRVEGSILVEQRHIPAAGQIIHLTANPAIPLPIIHEGGKVAGHGLRTMGWKMVPLTILLPLVRKWGTSGSIPVQNVKSWRNNFV